MAYSHYRTGIRTQIPNLMSTLYYAEVFTLVLIWIWIPTWMVFQMVTVSILGMDLRPKDRSSSHFTTSQSGDQSLNPNQWKISAWYSNPCLSRDPSPDPAM